MTVFEQALLEKIVYQFALTNLMTAIMVGCAIAFAAVLAITL